MNANTQSNAFGAILDLLKKQVEQYNSGNRPAGNEFADLEIAHNGDYIDVRYWIQLTANNVNGQLSRFEVTFEVGDPDSTTPINNVYVALVSGNEDREQITSDKVVDIIASKINDACGFAHEFLMQCQTAGLKVHNKPTIRIDTIVPGTALSHAGYQLPDSLPTPAYQAETLKAISTANADDLATIVANYYKAVLKNSGTGMGSWSDMQAELQRSPYLAHHQGAQVFGKAAERLDELERSPDNVASTKTENAPLHLRSLFLNRTRDDGFLHSDVLLLDANRFDGSPKEFGDALRKVIAEYVMTPEGKRDAINSDLDFNWGDFVMATDNPFFEQAGVFYCENKKINTLIEEGAATLALPNKTIILDVDQDEVLIPVDSPLWDEVDEDDPLAGQTKGSELKP
jgi:hypothetical protein